MINGLSDRLKECRIKYGYSQKQVAERLSISPSIVSGYARGERTPSPENLIALSHLYNCSIDYLLGKERKKSSITLDVSGLSKKQIQVLSELINVMKHE